MSSKTLFGMVIIFLFMLQSYLFAQNYPDQRYVIKIDSIFENIEVNVGMTLSNDGKSIMLQDGVNDGYIILKPQYSESPFNEGLLPGMEVQLMLTMDLEFKCDSHIMADGHLG